MSIAGNLKTMDLAELLQWLSQSQKTGTLVIHDGKVEKRLFLENGKIVSSASTDPREYLGHFLVSQGLITEQQLSQAMARQSREQMLLGKILLTAGAVSEEDLQRLLKLKAEESIYDIFTWGTGEFRFINDELPDRKFIPLRLDLTGILMEGARRVDEWRRIREFIPSKETVPVSVTDLADPSLSPGAQRILAMVNDDRTVEEIQLQTHSSEFFVCAVLFEQINRGRVKVVKPRIVQVEVPVPMAAPAQAPPAAQPAPAPAPPPSQSSVSPPPGGGSSGYPPPAAGGGGFGLPPSAPAAPQGSGQSPPAAPGTSFDQLDPDTLIRSASEMIQQQDYERALRYLRAARSLRPEDRNLEGAVAHAEQQIRSAIEQAGITLAKVPKVSVPIEQLTSLSVSAQEGFLLTRIDGRYDIRSILKISPMPEIDALIMFQRLYSAGHITL